MKKKYKVHKSHFSVFMYVYISLRSVFGSASTGHNRQVVQYRRRSILSLDNSRTPRGHADHRLIVFFSKMASTRSGTTFSTYGANDARTLRSTYTPYVAWASIWGLATRKVRILMLYR